MSVPPQVSLGGVLCNGTAVSDDGLWLATTTPSQEQLCASSSGCGYATLVVRNPPSDFDAGADAVRRRAAAAASGGATFYSGAALACPPFCPRADAASLVPRAVGDDASAAASFVPASVQVSASGALVMDATSSLVLLSSGSAASTGSTSAGATSSGGGGGGSTGVYYTVSCAASGLFTDPSTGACSNASDPAHARCAFGSGASCVMCPTGERGVLPEACIPARLHLSSLRCVSHPSASLPHRRAVSRWLARLAAARLLVRLRGRPRRAALRATRAHAALHGLECRCGPRRLRRVV